MVMPETDFGQFSVLYYLNSFHRKPAIPATIIMPAIFFRLQQPFFAGTHPPVLQLFLAIEPFPETSVVNYVISTIDTGKYSRSLKSSMSAGKAIPTPS
ncbi:hypothetical protein [Acetobacter sp.]|uniref:hypothetical protein n=1 Tax=Acetobacter sp. TaxID=440 RepID=UPI0025B85270|nr:hypothetical protein [Acetobacter sp.]MCH4091338.1 hypothetical protein [Acetobacter sp.]MCI1299316.1 hypothetical protein [Acetobacter sp.]MCI1316680.1 hypothetical protein [Acetobacter sp.]